MKKLLFLLAIGFITQSDTCVEDPVVNPGPDPNVQHQNANAYLFWNWESNNYFNIDQKVKIEQLGTSTFWALSVNFEGETTGAYLGLQTKADGSSNGLAIFSLWDANGCKTGDSGTYCQDFDGEGTGKSVRTDFQVLAGHTYRFRLWRMGSDAQGQWWGAWIKNTSTGQETYLGELRRPNAVNLRSGAVNFMEYFGGQVACGMVPRASASFFSPTANNDDPTNTSQFGSSYSHFSKGNCVEASVQLLTVGGVSGVPFLVHGTEN